MKCSAQFYEITMLGFHSFDICDDSGMGPGLAAITGFAGVTGHTDAGDQQARKSP